MYRQRVLGGMGPAIDTLPAEARDTPVAPGAREEVASFSSSSSSFSSVPSGVMTDVSLRIPGPVDTAVGVPATSRAAEGGTEAREGRVPVAAAAAACQQALSHEMIQDQWLRDHFK